MHIHAAEPLIIISLTSVNNTLLRTISADPIMQLPSTIDLAIYHSQ